MHAEVHRAVYLLCGLVLCCEVEEQRCCVLRVDVLTGQDAYDYQTRSSYLLKMKSFYHGLFALSVFF